MQAIFRNYLITLLFAGLAAPILLNADTLGQTLQRVATLKVVKNGARVKQLLANKPCAAAVKKITIDTTKNPISDSTTVFTSKFLFSLLNETRYQMMLCYAAAKTKGPRTFIVVILTSACNYELTKYIFSETSQALNYFFSGLSQASL